jgi:hypothetical protein
MTVDEILSAAQSLTFEERKKLIRGLFEMDARDRRAQSGFKLAGSIEIVGDLEEGSRAIREMVNRSLERTAAQLREFDEETA